MGRTGSTRAVILVVAVALVAAAGIVAQAATAQRTPGLVREGLVWLGSAPWLPFFLASRCLGQLGRLLAIVIGSALWLPMLICPGGFVRWMGRLMGAVLVALIGAILVSNGLAGSRWSSRYLGMKRVSSMLRRYAPSPRRASDIRNLGASFR